MSGIDAIAAERKRQVEAEGWTPEHDDQHTLGELAITAACYAAHQRAHVVAATRRGPLSLNDAWPEWWDDQWDKRETFDERQRLVVAGALIAAEIDRLDRQQIMKIDPKAIPAFDGVLEQWEQDEDRVVGLIYYDKKGRFSNGVQIRTSAIDRVEGPLLYTRNSVYVLGAPKAEGV